MQENILEVKGITKSFPGTKALSDVSLTLKKGEVHALVGENGAGKSTLMNIIDGVLQPDSGEIYIDGKKADIKNPNDAQKLGIGFVHQEIALCQHVSVAENIFMSSINEQKEGFVNFRNLNRKAADILKPLTDEINPSRIVNTLNISKQQVVEIARALTCSCRILILDEPTSALTENEAQALFKIIRELKKNGMGIIYISHRMAEVFSECDRVSILRDGSYIGTFEVKETDSKTVVNKMVGRIIGDVYPKKKEEGINSNDVLFEIKNFSDKKRFNNINIKLYPGEIVGLFGLTGAGRSELAQGVCGFRKVTSGEIYYKGVKLKIESSYDAIKKGLVYLTEDRKIYGLFLEMSIKKNISALNLKFITKMGLIDQRKEKAQGLDYVEKLGIRSPSIDKAMSKLSGGNQQKVLISKLLTVKPKVIFSGRTDQRN